MAENNALNEKDALFERNFNALKMMYRAGKIQKINRAEREILEFCHGRNMIEFIREEFKRNPILYDENGDIIENPKYDVGDCPHSFFAGDSENRQIIM